MNSPRSTRILPVQPWREVIREFLGALGERHTYSPRKNTEFVFGFLWGLPIPVAALLIHVYALGLPWEIGVCCGVLAQHPMHAFFLLHPPLFAVVFGALGTMRADREHRIRGLVEDVRQRCQELDLANARLTELDQLKSEFLANVTHELKSPLVVALGYTDRILSRRMGELNEQQRKGLEVSRRNLIQLRELIDEILSFSRMESGKISFDLRPTDWLAVVRAAIENQEVKAQEHDLNLVLRAPGEPVWIRGDAGKLRQVITNLLDNALKYSPEAGTIAIALQREGAAWRLSVADQGSGIAPQALPRLFTRFYQADGSPARCRNGVGLGLVIVKKIVEAHGGRVWIESRPGAGTRAYVELPALPAPPADGPAGVKEATHAQHSSD